MDRRADAQGSRIAGILVVLGVVGFGAYFVGLHWLVASGLWPTAALGMILGPWVFVVGPPVVGGLRDGSRSRRTGSAALVACAVVAIAWLLVRFGPILGRRADVVLYVENLAFFVWLGWLFASTLKRGREPLVTRLARRMRGGDMPSVVVRYTRWVTIAWAAFFALTAETSTLLFFAYPRETWSLFVNVLIWPLVGIAFVVEYVVRTTLLRNVMHVPFTAAIHAFRERADDDR